MEPVDQFMKYVREGEKLDVAYEIFDSPYGREALVSELGPKGVAVTVQRVILHGMEEEAQEILETSGRVLRSDGLDEIIKYIKMFPVPLMDEEDSN